MGRSSSSPALEDLPRIPFPGIHPLGYAHRGVFFARDREKLLLRRSIVLHRGLLLFSSQGIGKSSLLHAGVIPEAEHEGYQPETLRVQPIPGQEIVVRRIPESEAPGPPFRPTIFATDERPSLVLSVEQFLERVRGAAETTRPLLIFDQFEEWVTLGQSALARPSLEGLDERAIQEARGRVRDAIVSLLRSEKLATKVFIALREDYLGSLAPLFRVCPELTEHYVRLEPLTRDQVYAAIRGPFERFPGTYACEISAGLAQRTCDDLGAVTEAGDIRLGEVQIVCRTLFTQGLDGREPEQVFEEMGGARGIIEQYFATTVESVAEDEREPAVALLGHLLTPAGTRNLVAEDNLVRLVQAEEPFDVSLLRRALQSLDTRAGVVRSEWRREVRYYEIASEFLVDWIRRQTEERQRRIEVQKLRAQLEREQRERRQKRRVTLLSSLAVGLAVSLAVAGFSAWRAHQERIAAERLRFDALSQALAASAQVEMEEYGALLARQAYEFARRGTGQLTLRVEPTLRAALRWSYIPDFLRGHRANIFMIAANARRGVLVSASVDSTVRLWSVAISGGSPPAPLRGPTEHVAPTALLAVAAPADTSVVVAAGENGRVYLWNLRTGRPDSLGDEGSPVYSVAVTSDGRWLAAGDRRGAVRLWDLRRRIPLDSLSHGAAIWSLVFIPEAQQLISADVDGITHVWQLSREAAPVLLRSLAGVSVAVSGDSRYIASGGLDGTIRIWDRENLREPSVSFAGPRSAVTSVAFGPDGKTLVSATMDSTVRLWDLRMSSAGPIEVGKLEGEVYSVTYLPDGTSVAASGSAKHVKIWHGVGRDMAEVGEALLASTDSEIEFLAASSDGRMLAAITTPRRQRSDLQFSWLPAGGRVVLWDTQRRDARRPRWLRSDNVTAVALSADHHTLAFGDSRGHVGVGSLTEEAAPTRSAAAHRDRVLALSFSPDGTLLASAGADETTRVWRTQGTLQQVAALPQGDWVRAVGFSPDGRYLATAGDDRTVRLWDAESAFSSVDVLGPFDAWMRSLAFDPRGRVMASGDQDGIIHLWNLDHLGTSARLLRGRTEEPVTALTFSPDGQRLVSGDESGTIRVWSVETESAPAEIEGHSGTIRGLAFSENGHMLISGAQDGTVRGWLVGGDSLAALICNRLRRNQTLREWHHLVPPDLPYERSCPNLPIHSTFLTAGVDAARRGDLDSAITVFARVSQLDTSALSAPPEIEARLHRAQALLELAREAMRSGLLDSSNALLRTARTLDPDLDPDREMRSTYAEHLAARAGSLAMDTAASEAVVAIDSAWMLDSTQVEGDQLNRVCWYGALDGHAARVLHVCERAVTVSSGRAYIRDSRGLARALTGDVRGAVEDFEAFAGSRDGDSSERRQRRRWARALEAGTDPRRIFLPDTLRSLRD